MTYTNKIRQVFYDDAGVVPGADRTITYTAGSETKVSEAVPQSATTVIVVAIDVSKLVSLLLLCDKVCTVETNGTGVGADDSVSLAAGVPMMWSADTGGANPFVTADVTALHITLGAVGAGTFKMIALVDPT